MKENRKKQVRAISLIVNLVVAIISFSALMNLQVVSAQNNVIEYHVGDIFTNKEKGQSFKITKIAQDASGVEKVYFDVIQGEKGGVPIDTTYKIDSATFSEQLKNNGFKKVDSIIELLNTPENAAPPKAPIPVDGSRSPDKETAENVDGLEDVEKQTTSTGADALKKLNDDFSKLKGGESIEGTFNGVEGGITRLGSVLAFLPKGKTESTALTEENIKDFVAKSATGEYSGTIKGPAGILGQIGLKTTGAFWGDMIIQGAGWAVTVYVAIGWLGGLIGLSPQLTSALQTSVAAGVMAGHLAQAIGGETFPGGILAAEEGTGFLGLGAAGIGIGVAIVVFLLTYKESRQEIISFECYSWEAPSAGKDCQKCNSDLYSCSEYRCKSLGQGCELINPGTDEESCAWVYIGDTTSPEIQPWKEPLTPGHKYDSNAIRPPDRGVKIINSEASDGCIKAFTPLEFGIQVNEPAQCKIDYERKETYDEMKYFFGGSNLFRYNHSEQLRLPGVDSINADSPEIKTDGNFNLYVRCKDSNGNANDDLFVFNFCVEKGPDLTAPKIERTSIENGMPFQYGLNQTPLEVYLNEPSTCRWSKTNQDYGTMEHEMSCSQHVWEMNNQMLYKCETTLIDLEDRKENKFYFLCKDKPLVPEEDRNIMAQSYEFSLIGTQPLNIVKIMPNETITGYSTSAEVNLLLETENGYNHGDSWCYYSLTGKSDDWIKFLETGGNVHVQRQDLPEGKYKYYFQCIDLGGNADTEEVEFNVVIDEEAPLVIRAYKDGTNLKIVTNEKSTCSYSTNEERECSFEIEEGENMPKSDSKEHTTSWEEGVTYYIKCKDINDRQPLPTSCSITVRAQK